MRNLRTQLTDSAKAFAAVFANPNLRWVELAWAASIVGHWGYVVAVSVYAYETNGTGAVGLIWVLRLMPAAFASPFTSILADRFRRERVMLVSDLIRMVLISVAAAGVFLDAQPVLIYAIAALVGIVATPFRPAQAALVASIARSPTELTAANVVSSTIESVGFFAGPALAGVLLGVFSTGAVFAVTAGLILVSAFFILLIRAAPAVTRGAAAAGSIVHEALAGFRAIAGDARLRLLVGLIAAETLVIGALEVLLVPLAIEQLDIGKAGVGYLHAAFGIGALIGAVAALTLVGVRRLSVPFIIGVLLWGTPVLIAAWPQVGVAVICLGLVGIGSTLVDVAGFTLVQRAVPDEVLARVFGVIQFLWFGMMGLGAILAPGLDDWLSLRGALLVTGLFLPVLVAVFGPRLIRIDAAATAPGPELSLLRSIPIFAPLPGAAIEHLSARLVPLRFEAGTEIVRQGDPGDRFYFVVEGDVEVTADGQPVSDLHAGEYFGEIALLRDVPRTASVRAKTPVVLYALEREDFLAAVTGHAPSAQAAEAVVGARLAGLRSERVPVAG